MHNILQFRQINYRMKKNTLDAVLRSTWNSVSKMYNREASKFDSTMAMGFALLNIDATGTTSTALGPRLGRESTSLSRLLNNMEKKNLIIRKQNPSDGRSVLIFLTEFGKNKRDDSRSVVLNFNKHIESKLNKQQVKNFLEVAECIMIESKKFENFIIN